MSPEGNEDVVRAMVKAWNESDWVAMEALAAPDGTISAPEGWPESGPFQGWEEIRRQLERLKDPWDQERLEVLGMEAVAERTLVHVRWVGRGGASGLDLDLELWNVYTIADGKITDLNFNLDEESARVALRR